MLTTLLGFFEGVSRDLRMSRETAESVLLQEPNTEKIICERVHK